MDAEAKDDIVREYLRKQCCELGLRAIDEKKARQHENLVMILLPLAEENETPIQCLRRLIGT